MLTDFLCKHVYRSNPSLCPLLHSTKDCYYKVADAYFAVLEAEQRDVFKANPPLCIGVAQDNCWMSDVKASRCSRLKFKCSKDFLGTGRTQRFGAYTDAGGIFWFCSSPLGAGFAKHWWEQSCLLEIDLEIHPPWHRRWRWCEQIFNVALSTWLVLDSKHKIPLAVPLCRNEIPMFGQT